MKEERERGRESEGGRRRESRERVGRGGDNICGCYAVLITCILFVGSVTAIGRDAQSCEHSSINRLYLVVLSVVGMCV